METRNHSKNEASPKSQMSRENFLRKVCFAVLTIVLSLTFVACDKDDSKTGTSVVYYAEAFTVLKSSADVILNSMPSTANFEQTKSYRDNLKAKMDKLLYSENGLSEAEVKETFLIMMTDSQANTALSNLNDRGNNLLKGTWATNTNYYVIWYFEKRKK